jgi:AraC-like DNA-binding protein
MGAIAIAASAPLREWRLAGPAQYRSWRTPWSAVKRDLERWAPWASVSTRTLSRRFVSETGFNFTAWRQRARLMRSLEMLAAGAPVTAVALDLGYSTSSAFIGLFKRTFGETPSAYRQRL